jgi:voltage-gated potassium channel
MRPRVSDHDLTLHRKSSTPPWAALLLRVAIAFTLIGIVLGIFWFDRSGLRDQSDGQISFTDVLYFTMITITSVGYGDIVPVTTQARMIDSFLVTPIRLFVWLIFLGTAYDFLLKRVWDRWRMNDIQQKLTGHLVVIGYGTSGAEAVRELIRRGAPPAQIVVIDDDQDALDVAGDCGVTVIRADGTRNASLEAVRLATAKAVIVAAGRDDTSILIVLTARALAPDVPISVIIRSADNEALARQAGATTVINPASFAGLLLAGSTHGPHIADYVADLAASDGRVALHERAVAPGEIGKPLGALTTGLGVRVYRGSDCYGFWQAEAAALKAGDMLVEIVPRDEDRS